MQNRCMCLWRINCNTVRSQIGSIPNLNSQIYQFFTRVINILPNLFSSSFFPSMYSNVDFQFITFFHTKIWLNLTENVNNLSMWWFSQTLSTSTIKLILSNSNPLVIWPLGMAICSFSPHRGGAGRGALPHLESRGDPAPNPPCEI